MNFQNQLDYLQEIYNEDILSGVTVPAPLQVQTLKNQIMFRCGLLEPVYSEPEIMQTAIGQFFKREQWNITHLINIILVEYEIVGNIDKHIVHTGKNDMSKTIKETISGSDTHSGKDERDTSHSGKDQRDISNSGTDERDISHSGTDETTNTISAYNSSTYQPDNKSDLKHGEKVDDDLKWGHKVDDDTTWGHKIDDDVTYGHKITKAGTNNITHTDKGTDSYEDHIYGTTGETPQEVIEAELQLLRHFDIYDWIAAKLENELFIQVY